MNINEHLLQCPCGGRVVRLLDDGVFYSLTENATIIFQGICGTCGGNVGLERRLVDMILRCPNKTDKKAN